MLIISDQLYRARRSARRLYASFRSLMRMDKPKAAVRTLLLRRGYRVHRLTGEERRFFDGYDDRVPLPPGAESDLRPDHPRLQELERRYAEIDSPLCRHTRWRGALRTTAKDLLYFRGENEYVWQYLRFYSRLQSFEHMRSRYYVYGRYICDLDERNLLGNVLSEDGLFGCFTFDFEHMPRLSRDLLDSVNELYFLDRRWDLFARTGVRVLDIGAGYGRLAHRMLTAAPGVARYWCVDAVPRSTFLSEYYLRFRGLANGTDARAVVVPLDEMASAIQPGEIDLSVNIHSFSEMSFEAIAEWTRHLAALEVPWLLLVPNEPKMLSVETDGTRREYRPLIEAAGYRLVATEPTLRDPDVARLFGTGDHFFLFHAG
jgi:hypothetical protein